MAPAKTLPPDYSDLLEVIGENISFDGYCDSRRYREWETQVAQPALEAAGFQVHNWLTGECDSFGPLTRKVVVSLSGGDGQVVTLIYG